MFIKGMKFWRKKTRLSGRSKFKTIVKRVNKPLTLTLRILLFLWTPQLQISPS